MSENKMPIIDAHVHCWPYFPKIMLPALQGILPEDTEGYGSAPWLLHAADSVGVDRVVIICADVEPGLGSNEYAAECHEKYPGRFYVFADMDSFFHENHGTPGGADRLKKLLDSQVVHAVSQYWFGSQNEEFLTSDENLKVLDLAAEKGLVIELGPHFGQFDRLEQVAQRISNVPILFKHMGIPNKGMTPSSPEFRKVLEVAKYPNVYAKISEPNNPEELEFAFPFRAGLDFAKALYNAFGPERLIWGTDWPLCPRYMTYRQGLEWIRTCADFMSEEERALVTGGNADRILGKP